MKSVRVWTGIDERVSLSLGRSMRHWPTPTSTPPGLCVRRRLSGGGAVLRGPRLLRASVRLPRGHGVLGAGPATAARWFGQLHLRWLRRMGVPLAHCHEGPALEHWSCFAGRSCGEVLLGQRKIVGIAQAWRRDVVLIHSGTLLSDVPWALMADALGRNSPRELRDLHASTVGVQRCVGPILSQAWAASLATELEDALHTAGASQSLHGAVLTGFSHALPAHSACP